MADRNELLMGFVPGGCNTALDPALLENTSFARGVNVRLERQLPRTRPGARVVPLVGFDEAVVEAFGTLNVQGAVVFNPGKGQGTQIFGEDRARIVVASGGRKFALNVRGRGLETVAEVEEITGEGAAQRAGVHLVWFEQAERYLIAGDGEGETWIYDEAEGGRLSAGFRQPPLGEGQVSEVPSGIRAPLYAHGRLWVVVNSREVLAGDILHGQNLTLPVDLLKFTEQGYWAEGQSFLPPSRMGNIIAAETLPLRDTAHGHGELMLHTVDGGVFSIDGNVFPRTAWANTPMVRHVLLDTGASGPYALDVYDGDQIFRSRYGVQTLRSARAASELLGRPNKPISEEVGRWLDADHDPYLRFASLAHWTVQERLLCTVGPQVQGAHRFHRGLVSCEFDPLDSRQAVRAWEGLWTFPPAIGCPVQLVNGLFGDEERQFMLARGEDGRYRLVELLPELAVDVLEDGSEVRILCEVVTRDHTLPGNHLLKRALEGGEVLFSRVRGAMDYELHVAREDGNWQPWAAGSVAANDDCGGNAGSLLAWQEQEFTVKPGAAEGLGRRWRVSVRWRGDAVLEGVQGFFGAFDVAQQVVKPSEKPVNAVVKCDLGDWDYLEKG